MSQDDLPIEQHPLAPFIPQGTKVLVLGSFPPPRRRWAMDFFYPNLQNDFWRIMGIVFHDDPHAFLEESRKGFKLQDIKSALERKGIAIYDTVKTAVRKTGTASDNDLVAKSETDIRELLLSMPLCKAIVTTGGKAAEICARQLAVSVPAVGECVEAEVNGKQVTLWRMPSTSRAYPLAMEKKAQMYAKCFAGIL